MGGKLFETPDHVSILAVHRGPHLREFDGTDVERFGALFEDCRRAARLFVKSVSQDMQARCGIHLLNAYDEPAMTVEADGRLVQANAAAERMLANGYPLSTSSGKITIARKEDAPLLNDILRKTAEVTWGCAAANAPKMRAMTIAKNGGFPGAILCAFPVASDKSGRFLAALGQPSVLLRVIVPNRPRNYAADIVGHLYGLTKAETRIVAGIASGMTRAEIAKAGPKVTVSTIEKQLTEAFGKTETNSQAELMRLVWEIEKPN